MKTTLISLLPAIALVAAVPNPEVKRDATTPYLSQITVTIVNSMTDAVSTTIASNAGVPALVTGGESMTGTLAAKATATVVAAQGWNGNIAIGDANFPLANNQYATLIEPGLDLNNVTWMMDLDISYVNGYTVSVICTCEDDSNSFIAGCSKDLPSLNTCGADGEVEHAEWGACENPFRQTGDSASPFFEPCAGKAYTWWSDNDANSYGKCLTGQATCCVGTEADGCPSTPS